MSDVVAVALITGVSSVTAAIVGGMVAVLVERGRQKGETQRFRAQIEADARTERAQALRKRRAAAAERLQRWIEKCVVLCVDIDFIRFYPQTRETQQLATDRIAQMADAAMEEGSLSMVLASFSEPDILERAARLGQQRNGIGSVLLRMRTLLSAETTTDEDALEFNRLSVDLQAKCGALDVDIAHLNRALEEYVALA
jgi:hypothetical protein